MLIGNTQTNTGRIDIGVNSARTGKINIGTGTTTGAGHDINIGTGELTPVIINGPATFNGGITVVTGGISVGTCGITGQSFDSSAPGNEINIGSNQTRGILNIGTAQGRTGNINIGTGATGNAPINIGSTGSTTQVITINRPLSMPGFVYERVNEIGYRKDFYDTMTIRSDVYNALELDKQYLIENAKYMACFSLEINCTGSKIVDKIQYGLARSVSTLGITGSFIDSCYNNNIHNLTLVANRSYMYQGNCFFQYNSWGGSMNYELGFRINYLADGEPYVIVKPKISFIRII